MKLNYDFHLHSCLSPCGDADMTPCNIVNMAKIMGLDAIALTDHNTSGNCRPVIQAAEEIGLTVLPGMELCTAEEVHIVCLFEDLNSALGFSDEVKSTLPKIRNKPSVFGNQSYCDKDDNIIGEEETLLITASSITVSRVREKVSAFGGFCFPAHIDRNSYSIISNLGTIDLSFGFNTAEIFDRKAEPDLKKRFPDLKKMRILSDSDAHYLENMRPAFESIDVEKNTPRAILSALKEY